MKKFASKIVLFLIPLIAFIVITIIFYNYQKSKMYLEFENISKNYKTILMGDSQMQRINPKYFEEKTYNLANTGEHYFFTYQKLLLLTQQKNNIKNIVLGASLHSFSPVYNRFFDVSFPEGKRTLKNNFYLLNKSNRKHFFEFSLPFTKELVDGIYRNPIKEGLKQSNKENPSLKVIDKSLQMYFSVKNNEQEISFSQIKYLKLIDSLCSVKNINLYITTLPSHKIYLEKVDTLYFDTYKKSLKNLNTIKYFNFLEDNLDDSIFSDANHLNNEGAEIFSKKISNILNKESTLNN